MVDSLAQAYRWSFTEIMKLTVPQLLYHNHAAEVNHKRADERYERKKKRDAEKQKQQEKEELRNPFIEEFGKRLDDMNSDEQFEYFRMKMRGVNERT